MMKKLLSVFVLMTCLLMMGLQPISAQTEEPTPTPLPTSTPVPPLTETDDYIRDENLTVTNDMDETLGGVVDIFDLTFVASRYGSTHPAADINGDGEVNILDIAMLGAQYNKEVTVQSAPIISEDEPLVTVKNGTDEDDFGGVIATVEAETTDTEASSCCVKRPLKVGIGIERVSTWDYFDGQTNTPPDFYAVASVGGVSARTETVHNASEIYPEWRLGWWHYSSFPKYPYYVTNEAYYVPISLEIWDDDGFICYGWMGCKHVYDEADIIVKQNTRVKTLRFYPSSCRVVDDLGVETQGVFLNYDSNRCRVHLYTYGTEWPRAEVTYYLDGLWE